MLFASGAFSKTGAIIGQLFKSTHSPQVSKPLPIAHERISHIEQYPNFTPSVRQPAQLIVSAVISGVLFISLHFRAVSSRRILSLLIVAMRASHVSQLRPQQAISSFIGFYIIVFCCASLVFCRQFVEFIPSSYACDF